MNLRIIGGSIFSYTYNYLLSAFPSRNVRNTYLKGYLAGMGEFTSVQMGCKFLNGRKVYLGDRNVINFGCIFDGRQYQIKTGSNVSIGPEATILTLGHDPQSPDFADRGGEVIIGDRVWIGYRAIILPNVNIGEGAVVGASAVVTKNVESYTIVAGNPAKVINKRDPNLNYSLNYSPWLM